MTRAAGGGGGKVIRVAASQTQGRQGKRRATFIIHSKRCAGGWGSHGRAEASRKRPCIAIERERFRQAGKRAGTTEAMQQSFWQGEGAAAARCVGQP